MFHRSLLLSCAITGVTTGVAAGVACAQDAPSSRPDTRIVVTATRSDTTLAEMPMYTTVITQDQIRTSPAQTLDQLLR